MRVHVVLALVLLPGCTHSIDLGVSPTDDLDAGDPGDLASFTTDDAGPCDDNTPCGTSRRCYQHECIPDHGTCHIDDECQDDTYCDCAAEQQPDGGTCSDGVCIPWGMPPRGLFDPACGGTGFPVQEFRPPIVHCSWKGSWTTMTPVVADLDGDKLPEIIIGPADKGHNGQRLVALRGSDCSVLFDVDAHLGTATQLAVGDLDGDHVPEIVGTDQNLMDQTKRVRVFDNHGNALASSVIPFPYADDLGTSSAGAALANVDGKGPPEIVVAGQVLRYHKGVEQLEVVFTNAPHASTWGVMSAAADLDGDGVMEVIAGNEIYDGVTGADKTPASLKALGWTVGSYPAIADFNGDKKPDVALVHSEPGNQLVAVLDFTNDKIIFGPYGVKNGGWGGPPTIADFDGDGVPDMGLASARNYFVYALKCGRANKPADCTGTDPGVLWQKAAHDASSGGAGSSVFDFNGDGKAEVVYRDECWLRVFSGADGKTLFAANVTSGTGLEYPVIADVDNDGHADIVVTADDASEGCAMMPEPETKAPWTGLVSGLLVFRDPLNRWMPSRPLWNQHTYHITNINDDLSIPVSEKPSWLSWNSYRQNVELLPEHETGVGADLTGGVVTGVDNSMSDCVNAWTLRANLCNRGTATLSPGIAGAFYASDPRVSLQPPPPLCTARSQMPLEAGACEELDCDWKSPPREVVDLWFRADDDGSGRSGLNECKEKNNLLFLPQVKCGHLM